MKRMKIKGGLAKQRIRRSAGRLKYMKLEKTNDGGEMRLWGRLAKGKDSNAPLGATFISK